MDYEELKKDECGAYFSCLQEAHHHYECALNDYLGELVYRGEKDPWGELERVVKIRLAHFIKSKMEQK